MFQDSFLRNWDAREMNETPDNTLPTTLSNLRLDTYRRSLEKEFDLPPLYEIKPQDIICGHRGSKDSTYRHVGNERYRVVIEMRLQRYSKSTRRDKSDIVREIVDVVREYGGRFIRFDQGRCLDIGNLRAREKTGHAIRGALQKLNTPSKGLVHEELGHVQSLLDQARSAKALKSQEKGETEPTKEESRSGHPNNPFEEFLEFDDRGSPSSRKRELQGQEEISDDFLSYHRVKRSKNA